MRDVKGPILNYFHANTAWMIYVKTVFKAKGGIQIHSSPVFVQSAVIMAMQGQCYTEMQQLRIVMSISVTTVSEQKKETHTLPFAVPPLIALKIITAPCPVGVGQKDI